MKTIVTITALVLHIGLVSGSAQAQPFINPSQGMSMLAPGAPAALMGSRTWQIVKAATLNIQARPYVTPLGGVGLSALLHVAHINPVLGRASVASPEGFSVANRLGATYANPRGVGLTSPNVGTINLPSPFASVLPPPMPNPFSAAQ